MSNIVSSIIEKNESQQSETPANLIKLILQNKFIDLQWEIVFDDKSSQIKNISQVKIRVNFIYLNLATMKKELLMLILKENEFNDMLILNSLQKKFLNNIIIK